MRRLTQLYERTRRRIGLSAFLLLCLLPTVGMFAWGVSRLLPMEESAMETRLSQLFGLKVTIGSVEHPEPGVLRLRDLVFERPGLKRVELGSADNPSLTVARLAVFEISERRVADPDKKLGDMICMTGTGLEINCNELPELVRLFKETVDGRLDASRRNVHFVIDRVRLCDGLANSVTIDSNTPIQPKEMFQLEFSNVKFRLLALKDGPRAVVDLRLADNQKDTASELMRLQVGQRLDGHVWFGVDTRSESVPCQLLGMLLPEFNSLGPDALFCGSFWAESTRNGWEGELPETHPDGPIVAAKFLNVDLEHLIGRRFSQPITGRVDVTIERGIFVASRIKTLCGHVNSRGSGRIGQPLVAAAVKELELKAEPIYMDGPVDYEGLCAYFTLSQNGLVIAGGYQNTSGQCYLLQRDSRPILWDSGKLSEVSALLRTLAPEATAHIPAVRSIEPLTRWLPTK